MDERILEWLKNKRGHTFKSPREEAFCTETHPVNIVEIDERYGKVKIDFEGGTQGLPLFFWMIDRALKFIESNKERIVRLGAKVKRPFDPDTVEGKIWEEPLLYPTPYKAAPHVCDLLVLAGLAKYQKTRNPVSRRIVQGIKCVTGHDPIAGSPRPIGMGLIEIADNKRDFLKKYRQTILKWAEKNKDKIQTGTFVQSVQFLKFHTA
jgi:hypothetical protein